MLAGGFLFNPVSRTIISKVIRQVPKTIKNRKEVIGKIGKEISEGMKQIYSKTKSNKLLNDIQKSNESFKQYLKNKKN
jgi:phage-related protein